MRRREAARKINLCPVPRCLTVHVTRGDVMAIRTVSWNHKRGPFYQFVRPKPRMPLIVRPLTTEATVFVMHRVAKRMVPCLDTGCMFCELEQPTEYRALIPALLESGEQVIVDVPGSLGPLLNSLWEAHGSLSGLILRFARAGLECNSPVIVSLKGHAAQPQSVRDWSPAFLMETILRLLESNTTFAAANLNGVKMGNGQISRISADRT